MGVIRDLFHQIDIQRRDMHDRHLEGFHQLDIDRRRTHDRHLDIDISQGSSQTSGTSLAHRAVYDPEGSQRAWQDYQRRTQLGDNWQGLMGGCSGSHRSIAQWTLYM